MKTAMRRVLPFLSMAIPLLLASPGVAQQRAVKAAPQAAQAAQAAQGASMKPVASTKQIMLAMMAPSSQTLFDAVITRVTQTGTEEHAPRTAAEWQAVENAAIVLAESGNLLMMGSRIQDRGRWMRMSRELVESAVVALQAAQAKDAAALLASGERIYGSCESCHERYQPRQR